MWYGYTNQPVSHRSPRKSLGCGMSKTATVNIRLDVELNDRLAAVAAALDRPKSWVVEQAVEDFVAGQEWQLAAIEAGVQAADSGRIVMHEEVPRCLEWGETGSGRQFEVELSGQQIDHSLEISD